MSHRIGDHRRRRHRPRGDGRGHEGRRRHRSGLRHRSPFDLGGARYLRDGEVLPDADLEAIRRLDAVMLGAVGTPDVPPGVLERGISCGCASSWTSTSTCGPFAAAPSTLNDGVDMIVVRENTEGIYAGEGGFLRKGTPHEVATPGFGEHPAWASSAASASRSTSRGRASASTSRSCTRPTCSRSPATSGSGRSTTVAAEYPDVDDRLPPRRRGVHLLRAGPGSLRRHRHRQPLRRHPHRPRRRGRAVASGEPRRPTSTRAAPVRRSSSRSTARRPTSPAPGKADPRAAIVSAR